jgi:sugar lactone lactonase YvrE
MNAKHCLGGYGNSTTQLSFPYTLTRDPSSGTLYIADTNNHRVMQYRMGASSGTVVAGGYGPGNNSTQLNYPIGLYFDSPSNSLVIANAGGNNILRWVLGATNWTLLAGSANGTMGATSTMMYYPVGVTFDSWGNMYVADTYNHRIQFFLAGQSIGTTIAGVATIGGSNSTLLKFTYNLVLDADLNLYVADSMNHRVQKFLRY